MPLLWSCYPSSTILLFSCYSPLNFVLVPSYTTASLLAISCYSHGCLAFLGCPKLSWALFGYPVLSWARLGFHELSWAICGSPGLSWGLLGLWLCYCTVFDVFGNALVMTGVMAEPVLAQSAQMCRYRNLHTQLCCSAVTAPLHSRTREDVGKHIYLHPPAAV